MQNQPTADIIEQIRDIPFYQDSVARGWFPVLGKTEVSRGFPDGWLTPRVAAALASGEAEFALSAGADPGRLRFVRPPSFPLKSAYRLWSTHPDLSATWREGCRRVSLTTLPAGGPLPRARAHTAARDSYAPARGREREPDRRTVRLGLRVDPERWERDEVAGVIGELRSEQRRHPLGRYHLDGPGAQLAQLVRAARRQGLWDRFPRPASVVTAYGYTPVNVRRYLEREFACPVVDLFGGSEVGHLYSGDSGGHYRPFLDRMSVEFAPLAPGSGLHRLIVTSVRNPYMPLIRYRTGDCVRPVGPGADAVRGVRFCGRAAEVLPTPCGPVSQGDLDDRLTAVSPRIFLSQLRTTGPRDTRLLYTTFDGEPLDGAESTRLAEGVGELTEFRCEIAHRTGIPIGASGKYAWLVRER
ncbi:hypothetical protein [Streptomyces qinzhouensis]|uniref:Phenylacetate--CoA ligase family protein n=1 Tax=Streptomyces qinzhouensis TaxID=2599401 RepID=A0A5B8JD05_9ACTN|nr:hypothetical protein [Streptomyces qinzhouensis]QDY75373.1 hypothetical protein FQU76_01370 [Streptomyces qinzhouensis]